MTDIYICHQFVSWFALQNREACKSKNRHFLPEIYTAAHEHIVNKKEYLLLVHTSDNFIQVILFFSLLFFLQLFLLPFTPLTRRPRELW